MTNAAHHLLLVAAEIAFSGLVRSGVELNLLSRHLLEPVEQVTFWFVVLTLSCLCLTSLLRILIRSYAEVRHDVASVAGVSEAKELSDV
ncbi:MAG: hypothetical protein HY820_11365 [Acidobacteria bacterium]|nr:hypothetical protein [Acidobacteriota bacterium]